VEVTMLVWLIKLLGKFVRKLMDVLLLKSPTEVTTFIACRLPVKLPLVKNSMPTLQVI